MSLRIRSRLVVDVVARRQTMVLQEAEACKVDARRRLDAALQVSN